MKFINEMNCESAWNLIEMLVPILAQSWPYFMKVLNGVCKQVH